MGKEQPICEGNLIAHINVAYLDAGLNADCFYPATIVLCCVFVSFQCLKIHIVHKVFRSAQVQGC